MNQRLLFYGGLLVLAGGFALIPLVNELADNIPATVGPLMILIGYLLIGSAIIAAPEESEKTTGTGEQPCKR